MSISRRALGIGLSTAAIGATGIFTILRDNPAITGFTGQKTKLFGFVGGEKDGFVHNQKVQDILSHQFGLELDAKRAGSIEMTREKSLLDQKPQFLWPSSSVVVDIAKSNGLKFTRDQVIFNSPIVIYSWKSVAEDLSKTGMATKVSDFCYTIDLKKILSSIINGEKWSTIGVTDIYGKVRIESTDPNRSNSGFMFAGLCANLLNDDTPTHDQVDTILPQLTTIFGRMGFKTSSSGKLFEDYLSGGPGAHPLVVGYENQLIEWILEDQSRWDNLEKRTSVKPVLMYPTPTVFSSHPLLCLNKEAERLIDALMNEKLLELGWSDHGFRGPLGTIGKDKSSIVSTHLMEVVRSVLPMPQSDVMIDIISKL